MLNVSAHNFYTFFYVCFKDKQQDIDVPVYPSALTTLGERETLDDSAIPNDPLNTTGNEKIPLKDSSGIPICNSSSSSNQEVSI